MVWLAVDVLLHASVAVQVRVTSREGEQAPGGVTVSSCWVSDGLRSQLSVTVGLLNSTA